MAKKTGSIGVTTENIFPIIKKFLYSDHEIFLREIVSNAVDASQKLKTLAISGEFNGDADDLKIEVIVDKDKKTITVRDNGIGMTEEEVDKYINQIAFSSAGDFLDKYKNSENAIIGHFGLGFYSSFMVSKKVEVITKSYRDGSKAVKWECDGTPEYSLISAKKEGRGTDVILYIDEESEEFLEKNKIQELLNKYCKFLPVPIAFGKKTIWKDGKETEIDEDNIINDTNPLWKQKPADLKDEDYTRFYRELYPGSFDAPLFHIHLNVDYPFNLTGILYFPKIKSNLDINRNKIQLYSNQVFVTDSVEGIVPEFLTLLHGVIDSPDIPLNVSRSYLQSDSNVKKISTHITKKVADKLLDIFKENREEFQNKWDDLKMFIEYGMISDEKFYERAEKFTLLKDTDNKYFTFEEYKNKIDPNQKDKNNRLIYLYATNVEEQYSYIQSAKNKNYDVLLLDGQLDIHFINTLENKFTDSSFVRVDSDIIDNLIQKDEKIESVLSEKEQEDIKWAFQGAVPDESSYWVTADSMSSDEMPVIITRDEFMRRMKDMSAISGGTGFYRDLPENYKVIINTNHPLITDISSKMEKKTMPKRISIDEMLEVLNTEKSGLEEKLKEYKTEEEKPVEDKNRLEEVNDKINQAEDEKIALYKEFGKKQKTVNQLIDLALLANNLLKGEALSKFVNRSVDLLNK
ncbi:MAG: molecular chaperone HtpG [Bacteroidales bacterium]|jgi:molecular chaperone HtpG|nr:molecular chaperone HtpG [Bacteroidales bacterium]